MFGLEAVCVVCVMYCVVLSVACYCVCGVLVCFACLCFACGFKRDVVCVLLLCCSFGVRLCVC